MARLALLLFAPDESSITVCHDSPNSKFCLRSLAAQLVQNPYSTAHRLAAQSVAPVQSCGVFKLAQKRGEGNKCPSRTWNPVGEGGYRGKV